MDTDPPPRYEDIIYLGKQNEQTVRSTANFPATTVPLPAVQSSTVHFPATESSIVPSPVAESATVPSPALHSSTVPLTAVQVPESDTGKAVLNAINSLTHFLLGAIVLSAFMIANCAPLSGIMIRYPDSFSQHIYLCVMGYIILMSQAILSFDPHGGWAHGLQYPQKRKIHGVMQVVGSTLALAGCLIKITDDPHYYMTTNNGHKVTGWIVTILTLLSLIGGILNFKYTVKISQSRYKNTHAYLGLLTMSMAFICLAFAFGDQMNRLIYFKDHASANLTLTLTIFALTGVLVSAISMKIK